MNKDRTLTLLGGTEIPFRVVGPDDAPALQRLHARCSERTIYLRFFGSMKELSDEQARYFASTDGVDHFGLVALDPEDPNEIIAVVRYARKPGDERAEYAALVEDSWQGRGIGTALTHRLIDEARGNRVRSFYAPVKGENRRMLNVLRHLDLPEQERVEDGEKMVEIGLLHEKAAERGKSLVTSFYALQALRVSENTPSTHGDGEGLPRVAHGPGGPTPHEVGYWAPSQATRRRGEQKMMGRPTTPAETKRLHTFIGVAAVLWLGAAIAAVIDGDPLMALSWGSLAAFGGLSAGGAIHRSKGMAYLAIGLLVVGVAISLGVFVID